MNCFYWAKIIPVLIHLKHWQYHSPYQDLSTILIMFFIGFSILSYPIQPSATTTIGYPKPYGKPSQSNLLSSCLQIVMLYGSGTLTIKKLSLWEPLFFQS